MLKGRSQQGCREVYPIITLKKKMEALILMKTKGRFFYLSLWDILID